MCLQTEYVESRVMYTANKTGQWLEETPTVTKDTKIKAAISEARKLQEEDRQRRAALRTRLQEHLKNLKQLRKEREEGQREKCEQWLQTVSESGGVWSSQREVDFNTRGLSKTKVRKMLAAQVNVRTKLLKPAGEVLHKAYLTTSPIEAVKVYLAELIDIGISEEVSEIYDIITDPVSLRGTHFTQKWEGEDERVEWAEGKIDNYITETREFSVYFSNENTVVYLTVDEFVTDLALGDLDLHPNI